MGLAKVQMDPLLWAGAIRATLDTAAWQREVRLARRQPDGDDLQTSLQEEPGARRIPAQGIDEPLHDQRVVARARVSLQRSEKRNVVGAKTGEGGEGKGTGGVGGGFL